MAPPDRSILDGVRSRDPEALGAFFEHYFDRIFGLAYRLLGDREAAEDAAQDVFHKVQRAAERLDPERDPGPWLVTITMNTCRSLWRSRSHRLSRQSDPLEDAEGRPVDLPDSGPDPAATRERRLRETAVQDAISALPEMLREVVVLHDYAGLDHVEISQRLNLSHGAVRKRYSRALAELGRRLKEALG